MIHAFALTISKKKPTGDHEADVIAELCEYPDGGGALIDHEAESHAGDDVADEVAQLRQHKVNHRDDQIASHRHGVESGIDCVPHQVVGVGPTHGDVRHAEHGVCRHQLIIAEHRLVSAIMSERIVVVYGRTFNIVIIVAVEIRHHGTVDAAVFVRSFS